MDPKKSWLRSPFIMTVSREPGAGACLRRQTTTDRYADYLKLLNNCLDKGVVLRPEPPPHVFTHSDKLGHVLGMLALSLSARLAFPRMSGWLFWTFFLLLAPSFEWLQDAIQPRRIYGLEDALANMVGVLLALVCWSVRRLRRLVA